MEENNRVTIKRADPPGCECSGCKSGYSKPLDEIDVWERSELLNGRITNGTGMRLRTELVIFLEEDPEIRVSMPQELRHAQHLAQVWEDHLAEQEARTS